jgi:hypothetical protein
MADGNAVVEQSARRISPLLFMAALIGFFLTFTAVSCDSNTAKPLLATAQGFGGDPRQIARINACVDALNNFDLADYSGLNLAVGGKPTVASEPPSGCRELSGVPAPSNVNSSQARLDLQPAELVALILTAIGILLTIVYFVRSPRSPVRALTTAGVAGIALALVLVEQLSFVAGVFDEKVTAVIGPQLASLPVRVNLGDYFNVAPGAGFVVAVVALALAMVWNLSAAVLGAGGDSPPPTGPGVTPEEKPDPGPSPQPGSEPTPPISIPAQPPPWPGSPGERRGPPGTPEPPPPHAPG